MPSNPVFPVAVFKEDSEHCRRQQHDGHKRCRTQPGNGYTNLRACHRGQNSHLQHHLFPLPFLGHLVDRVPVHCKCHSSCSAAPVALLRAAVGRWLDHCGRWCRRLGLADRKAASPMLCFLVRPATCERGKTVSFIVRRVHGCLISCTKATRKRIRAPATLQHRIVMCCARNIASVSGCQIGCLSHRCRPAAARQCPPCRAAVSLNC